MSFIIVFFIIFVSTVAALSYGPYSQIPDVCASTDLVQLEHVDIGGTDSIVYSSRRNGFPDTFLCVDTPTHAYGGESLKFDPMGKVMNDGNFYEFFSLDSDSQIYMDSGLPPTDEPTLIFPGFTATGALSVTLCSFPDANEGMFNCFAFFGTSSTKNVVGLYFAVTVTVAELTTYSPYSIIPGATSTIPPVLAWASDSNIVAIAYQQSPGNLRVYWTIDGSLFTQVTNFPSSSLGSINGLFGFAYFFCSQKWSFLFNIGDPNTSPLISVTSANNDITSGVWSINSQPAATSHRQQSVYLYNFNSNCSSGISGIYTYINYNAHVIVQGNVNV